MKLRSLCILALAGSLTSSCIYYSDPVPEMPYKPLKQNKATNNQAAMAAAAQAENLWFTTAPTTTPQTAAIPDPFMGATPATATYPQAATPAPAALPAPAAATPSPSSAITQPALKLKTVITPAPATPAPATPAPAAPKVVTPAPAIPAPVSAPATTSPKEITNNGPIPVATPVPGDPTRVYNPLDSSKTIRITDKNGKVYPSGKELKVRGTNFHFYVP